LLSTEVLQELGDAPDAVKKVFESIPADLVENMDVDVVVESLAEASWRPECWDRHLAAMPSMWQPPQLPAPI
jgi:hypothetical protein